MSADPDAPTTQVPVLIVGGGVVGLSAALFLNRHGIHTILVERRRETSTHPRARSVNARTMEFYRELNIASAVQEAGKAMAPTMGLSSGRSLYSTISPKPRRAPKNRSLNSLPFASVLATMGPVPGQFIALEMLEPVLLSTAQDRGVDIRFSTECVSITQDSEKVTAKLFNRETNEEYQITASYCIAADGANSPIRESLGIKRSGQPSQVGHLLNILFTAPLGPFVKDREFSIVTIHREGNSPDERPIDGGFTSINNTDRWVFHLCYDPASGEKASDFPKERCEEIVSTAIGMDEAGPGAEEVKVEVLSVLPWQASVRIAERMQEGRIFLAGDSAHQMPPYAGQGANTGIADVHNLAWKLAAVLNSKSDEPSKSTSKSSSSVTVSSDLLKTYEQERLPINTYAASVSAASADEKGMLSMKLNTKTAISIFQRLFIIAGLSVWYQGSGVDIVPENPGLLRGASWRAWSFNGLVMGIDGRPGRRVPHIWLLKRNLGGKAQSADDDGKKEPVSTLDLISPNSFTLLTGSSPTSRSWVHAAHNISSRLPAGTQIKVHVLGGDQPGDFVPVDGKDAFGKAVGIAGTGAVLIRPDGVVAWRERRMTGEQRECEENLVGVMTRLLYLG